MPSCSPIVHGSFHATIAQVGTCNISPTTSEVFTIWPFPEKEDLLSKSTTYYLLKDLLSGPFLSPDKNKLVVFGNIFVLKKEYWFFILLYLYMINYAAPQSSSLMRIKEDQSYKINPNKVIRDHG